MRFNQLKVNARLTTGFGALIVIGIAVAGFGGWELTRIDGQVGKMSALAENAIRVLETNRLVEGAGRLRLRYVATNDEAFAKEFREGQAQAAALLKEAA